MLEYSIFFVFGFLAGMLTDYLLVGRNSRQYLRQVFELEDQVRWLKKERR